MSTKALEKKAPPLKFLLTCSDSEVGNFELVKLGEVANLRREMLALFDRLVDTSARAVLAAWLRTIDRPQRGRCRASPVTAFATPRAASFSGLSVQLLFNHAI